MAQHGYGETERRAGGAQARPTGVPSTMAGDRSITGRPRSGKGGRMRLLGVHGPRRTWTPSHSPTGGHSAHLALAGCHLRGVDEHVIKKGKRPGQHSPLELAVANSLLAASSRPRYLAPRVNPRGTHGQVLACVAPNVPIGCVRPSPYSRPASAPVSPDDRYPRRS